MEEQLLCLLPFCQLLLHEGVKNRNIFSLRSIRSTGKHCFFHLFLPFRSERAERKKKAFRLARYFEEEHCFALSLLRSFFSKMLNENMQKRHPSVPVWHINIKNLNSEKFSVINYQIEIF